MPKIKIILLSLLLTGLFVPFVAHADANCSFTAKIATKANAISVKAEGDNTDSIDIIIYQDGKKVGGVYVGGNNQTLVFVNQFKNFDKDRPVTVIVKNRTDDLCNPTAGITLPAFNAASTPTPGTGGSPSPGYSPIPSEVPTGLGTFKTNPADFVQQIFNLAIGIAGGITFLLIVSGALKILTSAGNPEAVSQGKEIVTSAIIGLLFIIFSTFILRLLGITVFSDFGIF